MSKNNTATTLGIGAGVAAAAAAGAAAYWLYGAKHSAQHRKVAKGWMLNARAEILDGVEKLKDIDKASYLAMAERVLNTYGSKAGATTAEMGQMMRDVKSAWTHMQSAKKSGTRAVRKTKSSIKKTKKK